MLLFWTLLSILVSVLAVRLNLSELESRESHLNLAWSVYFLLIHWWVWNFFFVRLFLDRMTTLEKHSQNLARWDNPSPLAKSRHYPQIPPFVLEFFHLATLTDRKTSWVPRRTHFSQPSQWALWWWWYTARDPHSSTIISPESQKPTWFDRRFNSIQLFTIFSAWRSLFKSCFGRRRGFCMNVN